MLLATTLAACVLAEEGKQSNQQLDCERTESQTQKNTAIAEENRENLKEEKDVRENGLQEENYPAQEITTDSDGEDMDRPNESKDEKTNKEVSEKVDPDGINKSITCFNDGTFVGNFLEAIEELRLRRTIDCENEDKIRTLLTDKHEMQRKWEDEAFRNKEDKEKHDKDTTILRKQYEERLQQHENDKEKNNVASQCRESEMNQLRDEVRALYLAKYNAEKRAKELEREIQLQLSARKNHEAQLSELDQKCKEAVRQETEVLGLVDKVEANVSSASRLHRKLMYSNEHHTCLLKTCKEELEARKQEVISLKMAAAKQAGQRAASRGSEVKSTSNHEFLDKELRMQKELCRQFQGQLEESRREVKSLSDTLKDAHKLVEKHVDIANKHAEMEAVAALELDDVKTERITLEESRKEEKEAKECLQQKLESQTNAWTEEKRELEQKLSNVQSQYDALVQAHNALEEQVSKLSQQNSELTERAQQLDDETAALKITLLETEKNLQETSSQLEKLKDTHVTETMSLESQLTEATDQNQQDAVLIPQLREKITDSEAQVESMFNAILDMRKETKRPDTITSSTQTDAEYRDESTQYEEMEAEKNPASDNANDMCSASSGSGAIKVGNDDLVNDVRAKGEGSVKNPNARQSIADNPDEQETMQSTKEVYINGSNNSTTAQLLLSPVLFEQDISDEMVCKTNGKGDPTSTLQQRHSSEQPPVLSDDASKTTSKSPPKRTTPSEAPPVLSEVASKTTFKSPPKRTTPSEAPPVLSEDVSKRTFMSPLKRTTPSEAPPVLSEDASKTTFKSPPKRTTPSAPQSTEELNFSPELKYIRTDVITIKEGTRRADNLSKPCSNANKTLEEVPQDKGAENTLDGCLKKNSPEGQPTQVKKVRFNLEEGELYKKSKQGNVDTKSLQTDTVNRKCSAPEDLPQATHVDTITNVIKTSKEDSNEISKGESMSSNSATHPQCTTTTRSSTSSKGGATKGVQKETGEIQDLFSDEEMESDDKTLEDSSVKEQIQRIQSLLNNDRLRTSRKRKYPGGQGAGTSEEDAIVPPANPQ